MTKEKQTKQTNAQPHVQMHGHFAKALSFIRNEIRNTEDVKPNVDVQISVNPELMDKEQNAYHINIELTVKASVEDQEAFNIKLVHSGVFIVNVEDDELREKILNVRCPEVLFPYTSRQIADITRDGGFPPMMIGLVNFGELYDKKQGALNDDGDDVVKAEVLVN